MIDKVYAPNEVEKKWYQYWLENQFFQSKPDDRESYTILIPPPNVTGVLHMGHMLNNTIQDVLIRKARLSGKNACWVPGTDHASIATEAKVVNRLKEMGIKKTDIGREKFLKHAWEWTHEHGGIILEQLKKLGASCDWDRTCFTLDETRSKSVIRMFKILYEKGLIYRGHRMVNWDPEAKTNISDEEVIYKEQNGKLYFLQYKVVDSNEAVIVATTRPETIFGDTAVCFHPADERYAHLKGKKLIVPIVNREVPVIFDDYIDLEFGTGALKVTPANDQNDYALGQKHQLESIEIFNPDATLNENGLHYEGMDRFVCRKKIEKELEEKNLLEKVEDYRNKVGTSERTGAVIEPRLSVQWYLKMKEIAEPALAVVEKDELRFFPKHYKNTYRYWMENITDWNISRQLWWGHQIPVYYFGSGENDFVVAETEEEAFQLAKQKTGNNNLTINDLTQDPDVLDTWFSSWLWPLSVFDGVLNPDNEEVKYYYPTQDLVTGPDIIFFWVARMIMAGLELENEIPFKNVYFTGIVRDMKGRKMSKSLGNSPDALELLDRYGADGVRVGILMSTSAGNDLKFEFEQVDENDHPLTEKQVKERIANGEKIYYTSKLVEQGRNFANKIWNSFRLVNGWEGIDAEPNSEEKEAILWMKNRVQQVLHQVEDHLSKYRISDALLAIYKLVWDDYCSWYLEAIKPPFISKAEAPKIAQSTLDATNALLEDLLKMLHPFMPFITEEIWQTMKERSREEALVVSDYPKMESFDENIIQQFEETTAIISAVRNYRQSKGLSPKESLELYTTEKRVDNLATLKKLGNLSDLHFGTQPEGGNFQFLIGTKEFFIPMEAEEMSEEEMEKIKKEITYLEGFLVAVQKKLSNEKFVNHAPEKVVAIERKKQSDAEEKIQMLKAQLG